MLYKILAYFVCGGLSVFQFKNCKSVNVEKCHEFFMLSVRSIHLAYVVQNLTIFCQWSFVFVSRLKTVKLCMLRNKT